jgi:hypothetical protein
MWDITNELMYGMLGKLSIPFLFSRRGALTHHPEGAVVSLSVVGIVRSSPR